MIEVVDPEQKALTLQHVGFPAGGGIGIVNANQKAVVTFVLFRGRLAGT